MYIYIYTYTCMVYMCDTAIHGFVQKLIVYPHLRPFEDLKVRCFVMTGTGMSFCGSGEPPKSSSLLLIFN